MSSFITVTDALVTLFEGYAPLQTFCADNFKKALTVKKVLHNRVELHLEDLPRLMIVRPSIKKSGVAIGSSLRKGENLVSLIWGFSLNDNQRDQAQDILIQFEETLDDALKSVTPRELGAQRVDPVASANDSGKSHPSYFGVSDVEIEHRR